MFDSGIVQIDVSLTIVAYQWSTICPAIIEAMDSSTLGTVERRRVTIDEWTVAPFFVVVVDVRSRPMKSRMTLFVVDGHGLGLRHCVFFVQK